MAMAILPVFFLLTRWVGRRLREVMTGAQKSMAQVTAVTEETLSVSGILLAKLFGRQHQELHHFRRHNQELSRYVMRQEMIAHSFYTAATTFLAVSPALVYLVAGYLISQGGAGRGHRGNDYRLHRAPSAIVSAGGAASASLGGTAIVGSVVRPHLRLPGLGAGDSRCPRSGAFGAGAGGGGSGLRLGAGGPVAASPSQWGRCPRRIRRPRRPRRVAPVGAGRRELPRPARPTGGVRRA